jgi:YD repeat-containing protein
MKKLLLTPFILLLLIASCKKDDAPAAKNLLDKTVTKVGADSTVTTYTYDAQNRFVKESTNDPVNNETTSLTLTRDNSGRVSKLVDAVTGSSSESLTTDFFYLSTADAKLKNGKTIYTDVSGTYKDSAAFEYNGSQVTRTNHYYSQNNGPYVLGDYYVFTYDSRNNITSVKYYRLASGGTFPLVGTITYTYDDKINPIYSKDDALIEYLINQYVSPNNVTTLAYTDATSPADNFTVNVAYEYRSDGRPTKSTLTVLGSSSVTTYSYK